MNAAERFVDRYLAGDPEARADLDRVIDEHTGLADGADVLAVIGDPRLAPVVMHALSDLMHPTDSMYFDAIFGAEYGQRDIRNWLVPTMEEISFIEFAPQAATETFTDPSGAVTSSVDEWQMFANLEGERIPMPRGVSVRHYRDGWITWNADVYDTGPFRSPPPGEDAPELPPVPDTPWESRPPAAPALSEPAQAFADAEGSDARDGARRHLSHQDLHDLLHHPRHGADPGIVADLMHPTESVYLDPLFGDFAGRDAIRQWLGAVMAKVGRLRFDPIGPVLFNGSCSVQEWMQMAVGEDGSTRPMIRGTSVRRYDDGWLVYAADYFDTAALMSAEVQAAARHAGSTLTADDIAAHRS